MIATGRACLVVYIVYIKSKKHKCYTIPKGPFTWNGLLQLFSVFFGMNEGKLCFRKNSRTNRENVNHQSINMLCNQWGYHADIKASPYPLSQSLWLKLFLLSNIKCWYVDIKRPLFISSKIHTYVPLRLVIFPHYSIVFAL